MFRLRSAKVTDSKPIESIKTTVLNSPIGVPDAPLEVLRYPPPYRCALALQNDTDYLTYPAFLAWNRLFNRLNLEIAHSFWVWSDQGHLSLFHGHPSEPCLSGSPEMDTLINMHQAGFLDTLHGFGDWQDDYRLPRDRMVWALDTMSALGLRPSIYCNHGGQHWMHHNIGGPWGYYQEADLPDSPSYCLDLLEAHGFQYYWSDAFYNLDKFGDFQHFDHQTDYEAALHLARSDMAKYGSIPKAPGSTHSIAVALGAQETPQLSYALFNQNPVQIQARNGREVLFYKRFRGHDGPHSGNLAQQLCHQNLDHLEDTQGAVILYQHLGLFKTPSGEKQVLDCDLPPDAIAALCELAERNQEQRIWILTTERLLRYLWMRDNLRFRVEQFSDRIEIQLISLKNRVPTLTEVQGFSLRIPADWPKCLVILNHEQVPTVRIGDILSIPCPQLTYPLSAE